MRSSAYAAWTGLRSVWVVRWEREPTMETTDGVVKKYFLKILRILLKLFLKSISNRERC